MNDDLALKVAALKVVSDYTTQRYREVREEAAEKMGRGDRWMARSPLGDVKIAAVTRTDPKPVARVSDEPALSAWISAHYPDLMVNDYEVIGSHREIVGVLFEHAPQLLRRVSKPDPDVVKQIKSDSASLGVPVGPSGEADIEGVSVETPDGVVTCKPDPDALGTVVELFRAERLSFEGLVRPELSGGAA